MENGVRVDGMLEPGLPPCNAVTSSSWSSVRMECSSRKGRAACSPCYARARRAVPLWQSRDGERVNSYQVFLALATESKHGSAQCPALHGSFSARAGGLALSAGQPPCSPALVDAIKNSPARLTVGKK